MVKAKINFLWYKKGEELKEDDPSYKEHKAYWASLGWLEDVEVAELEKPLTGVDKLKDVVEDLADDGKLNNSNRKPVKKSSKKKK